MELKKAYRFSPGDPVEVLINYGSSSFWCPAMVVCPAGGRPYLGEQSMWTLLLADGDDWVAHVAEMRHRM